MVLTFFRYHDIPNLTSVLVKSTTSQTKRRYFTSQQADATLV